MPEKCAKLRPGCCGLCFLVISRFRGVQLVYEFGFPHWSRICWVPPAIHCTCVSSSSLSRRSKRSSKMSSLKKRLVLQEQLAPKASQSYRKHYTTIQKSWFRGLISGKMARYLIQQRKGCTQTNGGNGRLWSAQVWKTPKQNPCNPTSRSKQPGTGHHQHYNPNPVIERMGVCPKIRSFPISSYDFPWCPYANIHRNAKIHPQFYGTILPAKTQHSIPPSPGFQLP